MWHIHAWQVVAMILLVAALLYRRRGQGGGAAPRSSAGSSGARKSSPPKPQQTPEEAFADLRRQALETDPKRLVLPAGWKPEDAFGVLMEIGISDSVVTLACFADGDARLLYQSGGGMIGGISHENVRKAAGELVGLAQKALPRMTRASAQPLPGPDRIRFYVLTGRGVMTAETDRKSLAERASELSSLYQSGQEVVTQLRQAEQQRSQPAPPSQPSPPPQPPAEAAGGS
jgi:hypothetical protein